MTRAAPAAAVLLAGSLGLSLAMGRVWPATRPPLSEIPAGEFALQDAALASAGFRAAAADLAWIQLLQYSASQGLTEEADESGHAYAGLKERCLRVSRLDPSFSRAILYGAGILGWFKGVDRPEEAIELLEAGMKQDPGQPLYRLYLAALAYKKAGDSERMIAMLLDSFDDPGTPTMMRAILANALKARGDHAGALAVWRRILAADRDASEHARARMRIEELKALLRKKR